MLTVFSISRPAFSDTNCVISSSFLGKNTVEAANHQVLFKRMGTLLQGVVLTFTSSFAVRGK